MATTPTLPTARPTASASARATRATRRAGGYTLVELLVVLALIGFVVTLATPMIGRGMRPELVAAAERIGTELRMARGRAVGGNRDVAVSFDPAAGTISTGPSTEPDARPTVLPPDTVMRLSVAASERQSGTAGRIRFFPDGSATGGRITLRRGDQALWVEVDWFDGRVEVRDAPPR